MDDGIRTSKTFGEALKDAFDNYIGPAALADRAVDLLVDGAKEAYQTIVDLNKAMTDVQMVTGESAEKTAGCSNCHGMRCRCSAGIKYICLVCK